MKVERAAFEEFWKGLALQQLVKGGADTNISSFVGAACGERIQVADVVASAFGTPRSRRRPAHDGRKYRLADALPSAPYLAHAQGRVEDAVLF